MNCVKLNADRCHLLMSENKNEYIWVKLGEDIVWKSNDIDFLGITKNSNLRFGKYVTNICLKANRKLSALTRKVTLVPFKKRRALFKEFIESEF